MNGLLVSPQSFTGFSVQPLEAKPLVPAAPPVAVAPSQATQPTSAAEPAAAMDFSGGSGVSAGYVLDWRDPRTHELLVQVPMRTALPHLAGAATPEHVGTHLDTTA